MRTVTCLILIAGILASHAVTAQTTLNQPWIDQTFVAANAPFRKVLIIAVTHESENRSLLEEAFVKQIGRTKADAVSSNSIMAPDTEPTAEAIKAAVQATGETYDIVLLTYLVRVDDVDIVNITDPGTKRSERDFALALWGDWQNARDFVLDAGVTHRRQFVVESSVYDLESEEQIWTVQSYSMDPKSAEKIISSVSKMVTEAMVNDDLL